MLNSLYADVRLALRQFRRAPASAVFIIITLAIGIGANVTMAGVIDRLLLRPPVGLRDPARLRRLLTQTPGAPLVGRFMSYPLLLDLQRGVPAFEGLAASTTARLPLGSGPDGTEVAASLVTASYFTVLGVQPMAGRVFTSADGFPSGVTAGGPPLAVIAYELWQSQFGGDASILGRRLQIGKVSYTVIGIAPPGLRGIDAERPDVWLPITVAADAEVRRFALEDRSMSWLQVVARLRPGIAPGDAESQATPIMRRDQPNTAPYNASRIVAASVIVGRGPDAPREVNVALWLGGISALVLLIACANVANLLMAGAFARRREIATRLALGASRARLAQQMLAEAALLAIAGGVGAIVLSTAGSGVLRRLFLTADDGGQFVDGRVFAFTAAVALGTGLLVSLVPLFHSTAPDLTTALRGGATQESVRSARVRTALLGTQAALCVLLLVVAGLFARSLNRVEALDLGMNPDRVLAAGFNFNYAPMSRDEITATYAEVRRRVQAIPGVAHVAYAGSGGRAVSVHTKTHNVDEVVKRTWDVSYETPVDSTYFRALGTSLRGRDFTAADVHGAPNVAIINEPLARVLFPEQEALGQCIYLPLGASDPDADCWTVVGVLKGFWYSRSILKREGLLVYVPMAQRDAGLGRPQQMLVATDGPASAVVRAVRAAILSVRPDLPRLRIRVMRDEIEPEIRPWRLGATMFSLFGVIALVIAAVGLYAVVSFTAMQRATEIAIRVAMGARLRDVLRAVAASGLRAVAAGLGVGIAAALLIRRWIGALLFQTSPSDPGIILGVGALLFVVAALAVVVPTLRALRQNPATLLRN